MVDTIKFSQMTDGGDLANGEKTPGLLGGENVLFNNPWTFLPSGTTADRPAPSSLINYRLRFNTTDQLYEYYDAVLGAWTQLQESAFTAGPFVIYQADSAIPDGQNLGALADGILKQTITAGVATIDIAVNGVDFYGPGYTGYFQSPAGVKDINGNIVVGFSVNDPADVNYIDFSGGIAGANANLVAAGLSTDVGINYSAKGSGGHIFSSTSVMPIAFFSGTALQHETVFQFANTAAARTVIWPDADGTVSFTSGTVLGLEGTENQVLVNGTFGTPVTGTDIVLTTPQDIATTSDVVFNSLQLATGTIFDANGNVILQMNLNPNAVNYFAIDNQPTGNPVEIGALGADTDIGLLYRAKAAGQHLFLSTSTSPIVFESGTANQHSTAFAFANTATSRTVTFPDADGTVAFTSGASGIVNPGLINQIAYYAAAGTTLSGLTIANQGVLTTDGTGLPAWIPLIAGQILVGTTSGAPVAAAINSGTNITVANGSGSITVNLSGIISPVLGGTGVSNLVGSTITLGGPLTLAGAFPTVFNITASTNVTFPTSGTLATTAGTVSSVSGTANRITSTGGTTPVIDISASYIGQSSITTLGTIGTGVWQGTLVSPIYGGTGVNNGSNTLTLAGTLATIGAFASTFTMTGATNVTFPTSGTLLTSAGAVTSITGTANQVIASASIGAVTLSLPQSIATTSTPTFGAMTLSGTGGLIALQMTTASNNIVAIKGITNGTDKAAMVFGADSIGSGGVGTYLTFYNYQSGNFGFYNGSAGSQVLNLTSSLATFSGALAAPSINFGGTALANYVEGTWTPVLAGSGGGSATYSLQQASYTRIGNRVLFDLSIIISASTLVGNITITGLTIAPGPFYAACSIYASSLGATATPTLMANIAGSSVISLFTFVAGTATALTATNLGSGAVLVISGSYYVS